MPSACPGTPEVQAGSCLVRGESGQRERAARAGSGAGAASGRNAKSRLAVANLHCKLQPQAKTHHELRSEITNVVFSDHQSRSAMITFSIVVLFHTV
jgi:hypothetical protein